MVQAPPLAADASGTGNSLDTLVLERSNGALWFPTEREQSPVGINFDRPKHAKIHVPTIGDLFG